MNRYEESLLEYDAAIKLDPNKPAYHFNKGLALHQLNRYEEALLEYDAAIKLDPNNPGYHYGKGNSLYDLNRYEEALLEYDKAIELDPSYSYAWSGKGASLGELERLYAAVTCLTKAIRIEPDPSFAHYSLGKIYYKLEDYFGSINEYRAVKDPSAVIRNNIGLCYFQLGLYETAEKEYSEALDLDPKMAVAYYNLAVLYCSENKRDRAKRLFEICLANDRDFSKAREALKQLEDVGNLDWYAWWFGDGNWKKCLGGSLLATIFALIAITVYEFIVGRSVTELILAPAFPLLMLLLPSLRKAKFGGAEVETSLASQAPKPPALSPLPA